MIVAILVKEFDLSHAHDATIETLIEYQQLSTTIKPWLQQERENNSIVLKKVKDTIMMVIMF